MPASSPSRKRTPTILALRTNASRALRLHAAYGEHLQISDSQPHLVAASRKTGVELVVVPPHDNDGRSLATTVAAIRASRQGAAVYVYADRSAECMREIMQLARAGARGVIVRDVDDDIVSLRRLLTRGSLARALESVTLAVQQIVPSRQLPLLLLCIESIAEPQTASECARRLGVSRRTLSAWARKSGARGVRSLTSKCRVLAAIELIRDSGCSIEQVAHTLRFASSAHLHNTIRRYTGARPRDAAARDLTHWSRCLFAESGNHDKPKRDGASRENHSVLPPEERRAPPAEWLHPPNDAILAPTHQGPSLRSMT